MSTALDIRKQLRDLCLKANIAISSNGDMSALRRSIAQGFFTNTAELHPDGSYCLLGSNQIVQIHPSSCLFQCKPAYVIFDEQIQTIKCYMRDLCVCTNQQLLQRNGAVHDPVWVGSKWLLAFLKVPVAPRTPLAHFFAVLPPKLPQKGSTQLL